MIRASLALVFAALAAGGARASGFLAARFGGEHGHPTTSDPSAIYFNPAGLALRTGTHIAASGLFAFRTINYKRDPGAIDLVVKPGERAAGTPEEAVSANSGEATLSNFLVAPFVAAVSDFGVKNLAVGAGFFVPFGGQAEWDKNAEYEGSAKYPGAVDGPQRWAAISGTIRSLYFSAGAAYRLPGPRLSVGLAFNVVRSEIDTIRARNSDGTDNLLTAGGDLQEGRSLLKADATDFSLGAGVIWQPAENAWVGLSYQSQPGFGENTLSGTLDNKLGTTAPVVSQIEVTQSLPDIIRLGGRYRPNPRVELRLFGELARWSKFDRQCIMDATAASRVCKVLDNGAADTAGGASGIILVIDRQWKDAFGLRGGASWWAKPNLELFAGMGYDGNAVPNATLEAALVDMGKITASLGARFELMGNKLAIEPTYTHVFYFDRPLKPRARDAAGRQVSLVPPSKNPDMAGRYQQMVGVLGLQVEYSF